jgi:hypothetical protein
VTISNALHQGFDGGFVDSALAVIVAYRAKELGSDYAEVRDDFIVPRNKASKALEIYSKSNSIEDAIWQLKNAQLTKFAECLEFDDYTRLAF